MRHIPYGATFAVMGALALWSCGGGGGGSSTPTSPTTSTPPPAPAPAPTTVSVTIVGATGNTSFSPNPVRASAGQTVTFTNRDSQIHHIVIDAGGPDLQEVAPGATSRGFSVTSTNPVNFHCERHNTMVGSINGAAAPEAPPCVDLYGYGC